MDAAALVSLRLRSQRLRGRRAATPQAALRDLLAVQSQEFAYARWTLGQRSAAASAGGVEAAVADGGILRTHILRPTWHFVHRDDLGWLMPLSAPRLHQINRGMYRQTGLDEAAARRGDELVGEAVAGGAHKTREELADVLRSAGFAGKGLELAYVIMHAEVNGVLVSGIPVRSSGGALKQTYALFEERVGQPSVEPGLARAELAWRYFSSRGPATVKDCATWSGLTQKDVRLGLAVAEDRDPGALSTVNVDGVAFHFTEKYDDGGRLADDDVDWDGGPGPRIDLIQCYDEYIMGYSETRHYLGGMAPIFPTAELPIHVVLLDGKLAGWWRHNFLRDGCEVDVRMTIPVDNAIEQAIDAAVRGYGEFLGMPAARIFGAGGAT